MTQAQLRRLMTALTLGSRPAIIPTAHSGFVDVRTVCTGLTSAGYMRAGVVLVMVSPEAAADDVACVGMRQGKNRQPERSLASKHKNPKPSEGGCNKPSCASGLSGCVNVI